MQGARGQWPDLEEGEILELPVTMDSDTGLHTLLIAKTRTAPARRGVAEMVLPLLRRTRLLSPVSVRRGVVVRRRRAKLRPVHALSLTSWFRVPSQMERVELLSRASCFFVPSSADGALHVVGSSHVVAPWRWRGRSRHSQ